MKGTSFLQELQSYNNRKHFQKLHNLNDGSIDLPSYFTTQAWIDGPRERVEVKLRFSCCTITC